MSDIDKPPGVRCVHLIDVGPKDAGACGIYADRPTSCSVFECLWLTEGGGFFKDDERPDRLGAVTWAGTKPTQRATSPAPLLHVRLVRRGVPFNARLVAVLARWVKANIDFVVIEPGGKVRMSMVSPKELMKLDLLK